MTKWRNYLPPFVLFLFSFLIYLHNISPSVYGGDVGDMLSAIAVKGVPHPSGYPLFTILGILLSFLPVSQTLAWKVGLLSAVSASLAVVFMYCISFLLTKNRIISIITALALAFFYPFWLYAELAELFALNNLFELGLLFAGLLFYKTKRVKFLYLLSFLVGFSLSHHHFITLLFPALAILVLRNNWKIFFNRKRFSICLLLFLLGLTPYIYVPIAASKNPAINWDNASTLSNFIRLVFRMDYGIKPQLSLDYVSRLLSLLTYFKYLFIQLSPAVVFISLLGMFQMLYKKYTVFFISIFLSFFFTGPFFILYVNTGISSGFTFGVLERFYMISALFLLIFFPFGIDLLVSVVIKIVSIVSIKENLRYYKVLFTLPFFVIPLFLFYVNFPKTDLHNVWIGDDLGRDFLSPLPANSIFVVGGDTALFNTLYIRYGANFRKDVKVISMGTIFRDSLYISQREKIKGKVPKEALDVAVLESLQEKRPLFSLGAIQYTKPEYGHINWIPYGLLHRAMDKSENKPAKEEFIRSQNAILADLHIPKKRKVPISAQTFTLSDVYRIYSQGLISTGNYVLIEYNDLEKAKDYYAKAMEVDPDRAAPYVSFGYYYLRKGECKNSLRMLNKSRELDSRDKTTYVLLFVNYRDCLKDLDKAKNIAGTYKKIFHQPISEGEKSLDEIK